MLAFATLVSLFVRSSHRGWSGAHTWSNRDHAVVSEPSGARLLIFNSNRALFSNDVSESTGVPKELVFPCGVYLKGPTQQPLMNEF